MENFLRIWGEAATTTFGLFWMAFWAFVWLGGGAVAAVVSG
ncbi:MAG: hypothetical protein ACQEQL_08345 [Pseudomonadota bacterium]